MVLESTAPVVAA